MIFDGSHDQSLLIGEVFGTSDNKIIRSISSSGNSLFLKFKKRLSYSSYSYSTAEFVAAIKYNKISTDCQSWLDLNNNILMSPNYPEIDCGLLITKKFGSYITLEFSYIEVKLKNIVKIILLIRFTFLGNSWKVDLIS